MNTITQPRPSRGLYAGERTIDGAVVTFNGAPLDPSRKAIESPYEWGYEGDSPTQLAHALLLHHTGDLSLAGNLAPQVMRQLIAHLANEWEIGTDELDTLVQRLQPSGATPG